MTKLHDMRKHCVFGKVFPSLVVLKMMVLAYISCTFDLVKYAT